MTMTQTSPCCWDSAPATSLLGFSRPFVAFLGGSLVSRMGDALYTFALPWMAYELTHSSLVLGTLYATEIVPVLLFGAFAGVYVDRLNRRHLLLGADLLRATLVALIPCSRCWDSSSSGNSMRSLSAWRCSRLPAMSRP